MAICPEAIHPTLELEIKIDINSELVMKIDINLEVEN
jgi:hypothetical protein